MKAIPMRFPHDEVKAHEDALLYLMTYAYEKFDLLGLEDKKEIVDDIRKEMGFKSDQPENVSQTKESLLERM